jgi:hypothetical protein
VSAADRARDLVADWTLLLVRGLPETVARDRFDEIASDLWEHQHDAAAHGRSPLGIAAAILLRALRGVPADLQWRRTVGRRSALRFEGITMSRKPDPAAKPWVHLTGSEKPFDQTNGVVDFDEPHARDDSNSVRDLTEKAVIWNMINIGGGGGL